MEQSWTEIADLGTAKKCWWKLWRRNTAAGILLEERVNTGNGTEEWTAPLANKTITAS